MYNINMSETDKKYKIIIVDDDDFLVNMYATKFNRCGIEIDTCASSNSFLEKIRAGAKADLILLDIIMPDVNGLEVLRRMRQEKIGSEIPVVMLTNQNDEKDISQAKKFDIAGYIVKSAATPSEVVEEVIKIIKSSK